MFTIKRYLTLFLKFCFKNGVNVKPYKETGSYLYYEKAQHLMFLFKNKIDYEPIIQSKIKKYIEKSDLVFDIGGNIGQYALLFSKLVGDTGKVISIEPDYKNFSFLKFNVEINRLLNVVCLKLGVGDINSFAEFYRDTETGGRRGSFNLTFVGETYKGYKEQVETITLNSLIDKFGYPDFVKIDVEGFENKVIMGLSKTLDNTTFLIEVRTETRDDIFNFFQARKYQCYYIDKEIDVAISAAAQIPAFANLIFTKNKHNAINTLNHG